MDANVRKQMVIVVRSMYFALEERWSSLTKSSNISSAQQHLLFVLATNDRPLSITEISTIGCWHISTVTRLLKPLLNQKYVVVYHDPFNNRTKFVELTESGTRITQELVKTLTEAEDFPFELACFNEEEIVQFLQVGLTILQGQKGRTFTEWVQESQVIINE